MFVCLFVLGFVFGFFFGFFFGLFVFLGLQLRHMEVPRLGVVSELQLLAYGWNWSYSCWLTPQPLQCQIQASSVTYTIAPGSAGSLSHWARPRIEPLSSRILVGCVNYWATTGTPSYILGGQLVYWRVFLNVPAPPLALDFSPVPVPQSVSPPRAPLLRKQAAIAYYAALAQLVVRDEGASLLSRSKLSLKSGAFSWSDSVLSGRQPLMIWAQDSFLPPSNPRGGEFFYPFFFPLAEAGTGRAQQQDSCFSSSDSCSLPWGLHHPKRFSPDSVPITSLCLCHKHPMEVNGRGCK